MVMMVAVAQDAVPERLGDADAEKHPDDVLETDGDGVPERHCVTVADDESMETVGFGEVEKAADGDADALKQRLAVEDTVDELDCVMDTVADPEKVVPQ